MLENESYLRVCARNWNVLNVLTFVYIYIYVQRHTCLMEQLFILCRGIRRSTCCMFTAVCGGCVVNLKVICEIIDEC